MRIIPIEVEFDYWPKHHTLRFAVLHFDWPDGDASLLEIGWYQGDFCFDVLFWGWIGWRIERWRERRDW